MNVEGAIVELAEAQRLFDALPKHMQLPSLSPAYVAADALRDPLLTPRFLVWQRREGLLMHGVHEARIPGRAESDWQSAYGYGGPIASGLDQNEMRVAWQALDAVARERKIVAEFVRFHPLLENQRAYLGAVRADRPVVYLNLATTDLLAGYSGRARTAVRKALSEGLTLRWETRGDGKVTFPAFYRDGMRQIGARSFYLFEDAYFHALLDLPTTRVLSVIRDGTRLAMGVFLFGPGGAEYHLSAASSTGRKLNATNLLLHGAAQAAQAAGLMVLYLGGGTTPEPDNPLLRFKSSFAPTESTFFIGYRIHDPEAYADIQATLPEFAHAAGRVLFYRR